MTLIFPHNPSINSSFCLFFLPFSHLTPTKGKVSRPPHAAPPQRATSHRDKLTTQPGKHIAAPKEPHRQMWMPAVPPENGGRGKSGIDDAGFRSRWLHESRNERPRVSQLELRSWLERNRYVDCSSTSEMLARDTNRGEASRLTRGSPGIPFDLTHPHIPACSREQGQDQ